MQTPPSLAGLVNVLSTDSVVLFSVTCAFNRNPVDNPQNAVVSTVNTINLTMSQKQQLLGVVNGTIQSVVIENCFHRFSMLPGLTGFAGFPSQTDLTPCILELNSGATVQTVDVNNQTYTAVEQLQWWSVMQQPVANFNSSRLQIVSISQKVPTGFGSSIASIGVIGLCKSSHRAQSHQR